MTIEFGTASAGDRYSPLFAIYLTVDVHKVLHNFTLQEERIETFWKIDLVNRV